MVVDGFCTVQSYPSRTLDGFTLSEDGANLTWDMAPLHSSRGLYVFWDK